MGRAGVLTVLRRRVRQATDPIAAFWAWWSGARSRVERGLESGDLGTLPDEFSARVNAIAPGLEWELAKGHVARHALCVTAAGKGELRAVTERWRLAGPPPDSTWEYNAARAADPGAFGKTLIFDGVELDLAETRIGVSVDDDRQQVDVVVHHPRFTSMTDDAKATVGYLVIDWLLGEDGVERWVGGVERSDVDPPAAVPADALPEIVAALQQRHADPTWAIFKPWDRDGWPVLVVARRPLKRVEHPLFDLHGAIVLPFADQTPSGLPERPALDRLRAFEDHLISVAGQDVLIAAHETHAGTRIIHLYCDGQGSGRSTVDDFLARQRWTGLRVNWDHDPGWEAIRPYQ